MAATSKIEWTEVTWNPVTGCNKVSPGCKHCYAEAMAKRLRAMGLRRYEQGFQVSLHEEDLDVPRRWAKPRVVFVNSMSDLFHDDVPEAFIQQVFITMVETPRHTYQVLTKRSERLREMAPRLPWPENVWMGVSVEDRMRAARVRDLIEVPASVRFLSVEPMLERIPDLPLDGIDWVIVGGESGRRPRPIEEAWVLDVRDQCENAGAAFFFKQWGGRNKKKAGRELAGRTYDEMPRPTRLRIARDA